MPFWYQSLLWLVVIYVGLFILNTVGKIIIWEIEKSRHKRLMSEIESTAVGLTGSFCVDLVREPQVYIIDGLFYAGDKDPYLIYAALKEPKQANNRFMMAAHPLHRIEYLYLVPPGKVEDMLASSSKRIVNLGIELAIREASNGKYVSLQSLLPSLSTAE